MTFTNTIGTVRVAWSNGATVGVPLILLLALPFACLAVLSLVALLGVVTIGGTLRMIAMVTSVLGLAGRKVDDPWREAVGDAHPLDYIEVARSGQRLPTGPQRWLAEG